MGADGSYLRRRELGRERRHAHRVDRARSGREPALHVRQHAAPGLDHDREGRRALIPGRTSRSPTPSRPLHDRNLDDDGAGGSLRQPGTCSNVAPGQYTVTESAPPAGWALTNLVCSDADSTENVGTRAAIHQPRAGRERHLHVHEHAEGHDHDREGRGAQRGDGLLVHGEHPGLHRRPSTTTGPVRRRTGHVLQRHQRPVHGYRERPVRRRLRAFATSTARTPTRPRAWRRAPRRSISSRARAVTCTFTNTKAGKVIVKKVMEGGTDTFSFTGTPAGSISTNNGHDRGPGRSGHVHVYGGCEGRLDPDVDHV